MTSSAIIQNHVNKKELPCRVVGIKPSIDVGLQYKVYGGNQKFQMPTNESRVSSHSKLQAQS